MCGDYGLIDNDKWIDLHSMSENSEKNVKLCINKMNELADENEQLRKENDMFSCELSVSANKEISRNCRIAELEEENEQLKKRIAHLKNELAYKDQHNTEKFRGIEDWARGGF
nr:hypothetical protein [Methanobrevibacter gottschalkii]